MKKEISVYAIPGLRRFSLLKNPHLQLNPDNIISEVCRVFEAKPSIVLSRSSKDEAVIPRSIVYLFVSLLSGYTLKRIGQEFGAGKTYSTVSLGIKSAVVQYDINRGFREKVDRILDRFDYSPKAFQLHMNRWRK